MSEQANIEQTKVAKQEEITELSDDQLDKAAGGGPATEAKLPMDKLDAGVETPQGMLGGQEGEEVRQKIAFSDVDHL